MGARGGQGVGEEKDRGGKPLDRMQKDATRTSHNVQDYSFRTLPPKKTPRDVSQPNCWVLVGQVLCRSCRTRRI